jgi:hypothetical protein
MLSAASRKPPNEMSHPTDEASGSRFLRAGHASRLQQQEFASEIFKRDAVALFVPVPFCSQQVAVDCRTEATGLGEVPVAFQ